MKIHHLFIALVISSLFPVSISALPHFFRNISSIPPSLISNATAGAWDALQSFSGCHLGQRIDGLTKIKQYFYRFGYIHDNNFTDDFDHALESAIRTYQLNFNLNATGELDEPTMAQMVRPRCGVADIINGSNWMNSGKRTSSNLHSVGHYSYFSGEPRWPEDKTDLTYAFFPGNELQDSVKEVFSRAFERWAAVIPMTFTETQSFSGADIRIGFFSGEHGDGEAFDGVLGTLAHAFSPPSGTFHLDAQEHWVVDGDVTAASSGSSAVDMESVAVHEIGHLLGMGHSSVEEAIMFPTISAGTRRVELADDDVEGIQKLYGSNPNYNGSTTASARERDTSGCGSHFVGRLSGPTRLLLAVVLVFFYVF